MPPCKHPAGTFVPVIDRNRCEGKGPCIDVCPYHVLEMFILPSPARRELSLLGKIKGFAHGWTQAEAVRPALCQACGLCVEACPEKAIKLIRVPA